jgi:hypothetical protein
VLTITARTPLPDLTAHHMEPIAVTAEEIVAATHVTGHDEHGTTVRISFRARDLLNRSDRSGQRRIVSAHAAVLGLDPAAGASAVGAKGVAAMRCTDVAERPIARTPPWHAVYVITPTKDASDRSMIAVIPITPRRLVARARRMLRRS